MFFSSGSRTLFVELDGVSFVEFVGPTASAGETGGRLGSLDDLVRDTKLHDWIRDHFDASIAAGAVAEARRLLAPGSPIARLAHVRCGYGGTGLSPVGYCAVMPYFDVTAIGAITKLRMTALVVDGVAPATGPFELRVWHPGLDRDHNEITTPFDGTLDRGATLRLRASAELTAVPPSLALSQRPFHATLLANEDVVLELEGVLDAPWPTA